MKVQCHRLKDTSCFGYNSLLERGSAHHIEHGKDLVKSEVDM